MLCVKARINIVCTDCFFFYKPHPDQICFVQNSANSVYNIVLEMPYEGTTVKNSMYMFTGVMRMNHFILHKSPYCDPCNALLCCEGVCLILL